ncbi:MAG: dephospho-CoA kinase, partial [Candidatus Bathyarchaeota archaeon]|nr:dephospho-CoA kinase [Candidatus Bathyarchaeota archaeon]
KRSDDPKGWEAFLKRDLRELSVGLGNAIAIADYLIVNEGTKEEFKMKIHETLKAALGKWMK